MSKRHSESGGTTAVPKNFRLQESVNPAHIDLTLDFGKENFGGTAAFDIVIDEPVSEIHLNAVEITFHEVTVTDAFGTSLTGTVTVDDDTELATIKFAGKLAPGQWKLFERWTGQYQDDKLKGLYRSFYKNKKGVDKVQYSTQCESTDFRRIVPGFDEPAKRVTWQLTMICDEDLTAISNTRIESEEIIDDGIRFIKDPGPDYKRRKKVVFKKLPAPVTLSTYLFVAIAGDFVKGRSAWVNGVEIIIWCEPGDEHLTEYALECCCTATAFYEKENESKFDGDCINEVPIRNFAAGAMENWGCITYRTTDLLIDLKTATHAEKRRLKRVTSHEHAHMDNGDKVTMPWWDGLCNNESYATMQEVWCTHMTEPDWHAMDEFATDRSMAMDVDSLHSTHPIYSPVNHPDDAQELFDPISYEKGCAVLFQIQQFIGPEVFRQGGAEYLRRFAYSNPPLTARWDMLEWACQKNGVNVPVRSVMDAWMLTPGHPVVTVTAPKDKFISLSQAPFKYLPGTDEKTTWPIPVTMRIVRKDGSAQTSKFLLNGKEELQFVGDYDYVVVNADGFGVYRVNYAPALLAKVRANLTTLSVVERYNLINDTWACVISGLVSAPEYLETVKLYANEDNPNVWSVIVSSLNRLHDLTDTSADTRTAFAKLVRDIVGPTAAKLGWKPTEGESLETMRLRSSLLGVLGTIGADPAVRAEAAKQFESWKKDRTSIPSDLLPPIVSTLAYSGDKARYDEFFGIFKAAHTPQEEKRFMMSLAQFRDPALLKNTIGYALSEHVKSQDGSSLVCYLLRNEQADEATWDFVRENWGKLVESYPDSGVLYIVEELGNFDTAQTAGEVRSFFAATKVKSGEKAVARANEWLQINSGLRDREADRLADHVNPPAPAPAAPATDTTGSETAGQKN